LTRVGIKSKIQVIRQHMTDVSVLHATVAKHLEMSSGRSTELSQCPGRPDTAPLFHQDLHKSYAR
jgi:hypothetical protein